MNVSAEHVARSRHETRWNGRMQVAVNAAWADCCALRVFLPALLMLHRERGRWEARRSRVSREHGASIKYP